MRAVKQQTPYYCGPACIEYLTGIPQEAAARLMGTTQQGTSEKQLQSFLKVIERPVFSYNYQDGTLWSAPAYIIYNEFHDHWLAARAVSYKKAYTGPDSVWEVMDPEYGTVQLMMVPDLKKLIRASGNKKTFLIAVWD